MICGFDLDRTLDRRVIARLAALLYDLGCVIHVITVGHLGDAGYIESRDNKIKKLADLGVPYDFLHVVGGDTFEEAGKRKADVINEHGIEIMIDDSTTFCNIMAERTSAAILRLRPEQIK